mmetsp:Transcript_66947/g.189919  ORF Transcript_66947/g.189919 Transcript_66947/m.189919 type:complete len:223 (+) Transcript_66947:1003-1671(+)
MLHVKKLNGVRLVRNDGNVLSGAVAVWVPYAAIAVANDFVLVQALIARPTKRSIHVWHVVHDCLHDLHTVVVRDADAAAEARVRRRTRTKHDVRVSFDAHLCLVVAILCDCHGILHLRRVSDHRRGWDNGEVIQVEDNGQFTGPGLVDAWLSEGRPLVVNLLRCQDFVDLRNVGVLDIVSAALLHDSSSLLRGEQAQVPRPLLTALAHGGLDEATAVLREVL